MLAGMMSADSAQIADKLLTQLQAIPQIALREIAPITGQAKIHSATANITLDNATINGQGDVTISADAFADASINAISLGGTNALNLPVSISIAFSHSFSEASIELKHSSQIDAHGNIKISTDAESKSKVVAKSEANTTARGSGIAAAFDLALAMTEETSTITVSQGTHITSSGSIDITSNAKVHNESKAATSVFQDGSRALTVAVSYDHSNVKTEVHGQVTSNDQSKHNGFTIAPGNVVRDKRQIELKNVQPGQVVHEGDRLRFESDQFTLTGTVSVTQNSKDVVGSGTKFKSEVSPGDRLRRSVVRTSLSTRSQAIQC